MIRPGRLDHPLFVALPTPAERFEILTTLTKKTPLSAGVDLGVIAEDQRARNFRYFYGELLLTLKRGGFVRVGPSSFYPFA